MKLDRAEKAGLGVAVVGHAALFAALSLSLLRPAELPKIDNPPIEVELVEEVAEVTRAPEPKAAPAPPAPAAAPSPSPPPAPLDLPKPTPPVPAPRPEPKPVPRPEPKPMPKPVPKPVPKPMPKPKPAAKPANPGDQSGRRRPDKPKPLLLLRVPIHGLTQG